MSPQQPENLSEPDGLAQLAQVKRSTRTRDAITAECRVTAPGCADVKISTSSLHPQALPSPLQFRLQTLFVAVAALSGLFATMLVIGAVWSSILLWFLLLVLAHVTANFWGTRVAPGVNHQQVAQPETDVSSASRRVTDTTGAVRLSETLRPGWPMLIATTVGAVVGGTLGSVALVLLSLDQAGYTGVVVGTVSASIVGGFLGFLTSSFTEIALRAWREAVSGVSDK